MINSLFPVAELAALWGVTLDTVNRRLSFLDIKPARHGNFRFLTQQEFHTACAFHRHIQGGQPMSTFVARSNEALNNKSHDTGYFLQNSQNFVNANNKKISKGLRWSILERDGHKCQACGATNCLEIDHIIPRSKGGETIASNLQVLCADCNRGKGASMPSGQIKGIPLKDLEGRWSLSRNGLKERAKILGVDLIRVSSNLTVWPEDKVELGDQLHAYVLTNKTSHGFYGRKNTSQFNLRLDSGLIAKFKACAYARGVVLGLDQGQSVNRAMRQAMQWYIDAMPE